MTKPRKRQPVNPRLVPLPIPAEVRAAWSICEYASGHEACACEQSGHYPCDAVMDAADDIISAAHSRLRDKENSHEQ